MKNALKKKARRLRRKGLSYKEIREQGVDVSKSTIALWVRDIPLKPEHRERLYTKQVQGMARGANSQKERRAREVNVIIEKAMQEIKLPISEDAFRLFGAALYWAEGSKTSEFKITNSDPRLISFMVHWLKMVFQIDPAILKPHLNIYSQQDELALKKFWSDLTGIPLTNFGKSYVKPLNKGYKKNNLYYGTIQIYVPKSVDLKHRVFGWTKAVLQNLESEVILAERKWVRLKNTPRPINLDYNKETPL